MKITFPHMSPVTVYKKMLEMLGHEVIIPPTPTQKTIDLGVKYSPEFACFPLKVILGSYIEAINSGAEYILTSGGNGPCRAGYYGELHQKILKNMGLNVEIIVMDSITDNFSDFVRKIFILKGKKSIKDVFNMLRLIYLQAHAIDRTEKRIQKLRAYEVNDGDCDNAWKKIVKLYDGVLTPGDVVKAENKANELLESIKTINVSEKNRLRVGIVGEIFVVMESSVNMEIERVLGGLGVETERSQYLSEWIDYNVVPRPFRNDKIDRIIKKGIQYIEVEIGGHARETVGFIKDFKDRGFDGIIHLMPFGCLPELVTQSIVPNMSKSLDMPILTIPIDEQTGQANNMTRIEAFVELIRARKNLSRKSVYAVNS